MKPRKERAFHQPPSLSLSVFSVRCISRFTSPENEVL